MKRAMLGILGVGIFALGPSQSAEADAFLSIQVNGGAVVSCDTSAGACGGFFTAASHSDNILFTGTVGGVTFGLGTAVGINLTGNQPGSPLLGAFSTDTKTTITNTTGSTANIVVDFAEDGFLAPLPTASIAAAQTVDFVSGPGAALQTFSGYGNTADTLAVAAGTAVNTPNCSASSVAVPCATGAGPLGFFAVAPFSMSGVEQLTLLNNSVTDATGSVTILGPTVPEPASILLFGTGLIGLGRKVRRLRKQ